MFGCQRFRLIGPQRPWRSLAALALTLAVPVSITAVAAADPGPLIGGLQRDLGALQVQLERVDPGSGEGVSQAIGFNTDLGDGSPAFRRRSMVTMAHAAARNLDRLVEAYREAGDELHAGDAETLRLSMYALTERIERLAGRAAPETVVVLRDQSRALLDALVGDFELLAAAPGPVDAAASAPASEPLP